MQEERFSLFVIDGEPVDWSNDPTVPCLRYEGLAWEEAVELCRLSFDQGYTAIIWRIDVSDAGGAEGCREEKQPRTV